MKKILITHTDLDGAGCAILFKQRYPDIEIQYHDYESIDTIAVELWIEKDNYDHIYFADITPSEEMGRVMVKHPKFTFIDHHVTRSYLKGTPWFATHICGTSISYLYLHRGQALYSLPDFVKAVDAYDTWKLDSEYRELGLDLNLLFNYYGMKKFVKSFPNMRQPNGIEQTVIGVLKKIDRNYLAEKLKQGRIEIDKDGNKYFEVYVSEKGGHIGVLVDDPDFPPEARYIRTINLNDLTVGLYAKDFDVSEIAKAHGGGGHTGAAGYQIKLLRDIYV